MPILVHSAGLTFGPKGSDAPYWVIGPDGVPHRVGGWGQVAMAEVSAALNLLSVAGEIRNQNQQHQVLGVVQAMLKPHLEYIEQAGRANAAAAE